jgi:uncharacterized RDD family membrane protein YckC
VDVGGSATMSLTVDAGQPVLATMQANASIRIVRWEDSAWKDLGTVPAADVAQFKLLGGLHGPALWVAPEQGAGKLHFDNDGDWSQPRALEIAGKAPTPAAPLRAITVAGGTNVRLVFGGPNGQLLEQAFSMRAPGEVRTLGSVTPLPALSGPIDPLPLRWLTTAAAAMLMMVVIGSARRGPPPQAIAQLTPAPLAMRFMAGMIDALPLAVAVIMLLRDITTPDPSLDEIAAAIGPTYYIAIGIYLLHTWATEWLTGRTIGKFIFGLSVVTLDGQKPSAVQFVVRNLLRLVDVMIVVPLMLVIFSPLRQRVGDIAARTVVVLDAASSPPDAEDLE